MPFPDHVISELSDRFERCSPRDILTWLLRDSGLERITLASSFQADGVAVIHMAANIRADVPILFLETGFHFSETLAFKERLAERLGLEIIELTGEHTVESQDAAFGERLFERDPDLCCRLNKVEPFGRALLDYDAWVTALRRDSSPSRAATPIVEQYDLEPGRSIVKVNPIANWSRADVWGYLQEHRLPHNPLYDLGYAQIGCAPCTRITFPGEGERGGRWDGSQKTECGIHTRESAGSVG